MSSATALCLSEELIALSILRLVEMEKAVVEGAGAIGLAAVLGNYVPELRGKKYVMCARICIKYHFSFVRLSHQPRSSSFTSVFYSC